MPPGAIAAVGMISATNLIVRHKFGRSGPCVALSAHGDVVPPGQGWTHDPYGAEVVDDPKHGATMYGRGVAVSKSDFATYAFALRALQAMAASGTALNGSVELHFTYDEEVGGDIGPRLLLEEGLTKPDYAIAAGFSYAVTTSHNGCLHLEVTVRGRQGHAAMPESGVDALAATTRVLQALYDSRRRAEGSALEGRGHQPSHAQRGSHRRRDQHERRTGSHQPSESTGASSRKNHPTWPKRICVRSSRRSRRAVPVSVWRCDACCWPCPW